MLRPSAFQNNGNSETASSSSKSILRPSSFQLAPSSLAGGSNKNECDEPTTSSDGPSSSPKQSSSSTAVEAPKEDDSKISSTTSNDGENSAGSSEESKPVPNPSSSTIEKTDSDDEENAEAKSKPSDTLSSSPAAPNESNSDSGINLFASTNTKNLFASATSKAIPVLNGSESNFVFGQNIRERIVGVPDTSAAASTNLDEKDDDLSSTSKLFAVSSASTSGESSSNNGTDTPKESSTVEDLTKVAREYEESRAQKRKLDAVETFTGEENEVNILDMSCKLFAFIASNWEQRGPGGLRLNDVKTPRESSDARSRVVFRTSGNFRVLINTKVWPGMVVEKPSQKSLRLTAIDPADGAVKIFLVMARPDDVTSLQNALRKRIEAEKKREKTEAIDTEPDTKKERKD